jgi:hypothetical protein
LAASSRYLAVDAAGYRSMRWEFEYSGKIGYGQFNDWDG